MQPFKKNIMQGLVDTSDVPNVKLCRFFTKPEYLDSFCRGAYRFGNLKEYKKSELDVRSDPTESESSNLCADGSAFGSFSTANHYVLCFTELNETTKKDELAKKFGDDNNPAVCKSIEDNLDLTKKILGELEKYSDRHRISQLKWHKVVYNKNEVSNATPLTNNEELHVYQKPRCHTIYRLKLIEKKPSPPQCVDFRGETGTIHTFSSLDPLLIKEYEKLIDPTHKYSEDKWEKLEPIVNNYEIEQEWRLVFYSDNGFHHPTQKYFQAINDNYVTLSDV